VTNLSSDHFANFLSLLPLPSNVRVVTGSELNTYDLMELATASITFSSQAGLEFASFYRPVVLFGRAFYSCLPLALTPSHVDDVVRLLCRVAQGSYRATDQIKEETDSYLYQYIFEYLIPFARDRGEFTRDGAQMVRNLIRGRHRRHGLTRANYTKNVPSNIIEA
jgi:hypothetical protein